MNYSIIIPHKNTPDLLERCINSIPVRKDLEIIIVDDNSSENIVDFDNFPGLNRENTTVIFNKAGKGAGNARNIALPRAKGKYIIFADADDFFHKCFNDILDDYCNKNLDVVYFNANSVNSTTFKPSNRVDHLHVFFNIYKRNPTDGLLQFRYMFTEPWCKLINRNIIIDNNITFGKTSIDEDVVFAINVGHFANEICIDYREGYCVIDREGSLCKTISNEAINDRFLVHAMWNKFLMERGVKLTIPRFEYMMYIVSQMLYKDPKQFIERYRILRKNRYSHRWIIEKTLSNIYFTIKIKFKRFCQYKNIL